MSSHREIIISASLGKVDGNRNSSLKRTTIINSNVFRMATAFTLFHSVVIGTHRRAVAAFSPSHSSSSLIIHSRRSTKHLSSLNTESGNDYHPTSSMLSYVGAHHRRHRLYTSSSSLLSMSNDNNNDNEKTMLVNNRIPLNNLPSPDSRIVSENLELILSHLKSRRCNEGTLEDTKELAMLHEERAGLVQERDDALRRRNEASGEVGMLMRGGDGGKKKKKKKKGKGKIEEQEGDDKDKNEEEVMTEAQQQQKAEEVAIKVEEARSRSVTAAADAADAEERLSKLESKQSILLASLPNLLDDRVPDGDDDTQNEILSTWGEVDELPKRCGWSTSSIPTTETGIDDIESGENSMKWHDDVAVGLGGWRTPDAVRISGARFVALSGNVARLERALSNYLLDLHVDVHGYIEASVPLVVGRSALEGTSQLPKFADDLFKIDPSSHTCNGEDAFLIPTAEVPLTNILNAEGIIDESDLPLSYVSRTSCFRSEAGSYGRDTRGLIRTHQFEKVELVKVTTEETSNEQHELLTSHARACLEGLKLPYRTVRLCSGDVGFAARHCYDLEVWLPASAEYREISSCSNTGDFQSRRMGMRYRPKEEEGEGGEKQNKKKKKQKPKFCHTINGSGLAVGRTLCAILENYQTPSGDVIVPDVLRPYMGGLDVLPFKQ